MHFLIAYQDRAYITKYETINLNQHFFFGGGGGGLLNQLLVCLRFEENLVVMILTLL